MSEQDWQDLEEKEILVGILTELQQIRLTLQDAESQEATVSYSCTKCSWEGPKEDLETHASNEHNAPKSMVRQLFESNP